MNLFIDTVSKIAKIFLFDTNRQIIDSISWNIKWNESSTLIPQIDELIEKNNITYNDIKNIVVVNWPWSFTGIRTTILAVNSIIYITKQNITAMSFFDLYNNFPILKSSSKRDCFLKLDKNSNIEIINNDLIQEILDKNNIKKIYWELNPNILENIEIVENIDYKDIIKNIWFDNKKQIDALYIKKPNIS